MKNSLLISFILLSFFGFSQKKTKLNFTYTIPYCGGARPTPEMEAKAEIKHPFAKKTIIYIAENGKVDSVKTDSKGTCCVKLKYGTYKFYESWKYYKKTPNGQALNLFDNACLKTEWEKEIYKVVLTKKRSEVTKYYDLIQKCPHQFECLIEVNLPE